ncbi:MAG: hypothetical protein HY791_13170 [Deltaproteobacteria bacterium]|nr:hypothetical protein [Deltaproteobacteria bacterium]
MDQKEATAKLDAIVGRAIRDPEYRQKLAANPKEVLNKEGLTEEDLDQVAGGALSLSSNLTNSAHIYSNIQQTFNQGFNPGQVAWSTDLTCNERG